MLFRGAIARSEWHADFAETPSRALFLRARAYLLIPSNGWYRKPHTKVIATVYLEHPPVASHRVVSCGFVVFLRQSSDGKARTAGILRRKIPSTRCSREKNDKLRFQPSTSNSTNIAITRNEFSHGPPVCNYELSKSCSFSCYCSINGRAVR